MGKSGATCFVIGDTVYIFGGQSVQSDAIDEVWAYSFLVDRLNNNYLSNESLADRVKRMQADFE